MDIIKREQDFNVSLDYLSENEFFNDEKECRFYMETKLIQYIHCLLYTSIQKIEKWDYADLKEMCNMDAVKAFREHALNPEHPALRGSHENGDVFFQHREACNSVYEALPAVVPGLPSCIPSHLHSAFHRV